MCARGGLTGGGTQRFLFEVRPDIFPAGFLTPVEMDLWTRFFDEYGKK